MSTSRTRGWSDSGVSFQLEVESAIQRKIHQEQYHMVEEAMISQCRLQDGFGYAADTLSSQAVLDGTYSSPQGMHIGTQLWFQVIQVIPEIWNIIPETLSAKLTIKKCGIISGNTGKYSIAEVTLTLQTLQVHDNI